MSFAILSHLPRTQETCPDKKPEKAWAKQIQILPSSRHIASSSYSSATPSTGAPHTAPFEARSLVDLVVGKTSTNLTLPGPILGMALERMGIRGVWRLLTSSITSALRSCADCASNIAVATSEAASSYTLGSSKGGNRRPRSGSMEIIRTSNSVIVEPEMSHEGVKTLEEEQIPNFIPTSPFKIVHPTATHSLEDVTLVLQPSERAAELELKSLRASGRLSLAIEVTKEFSVVVSPGRYSTSSISSNRCGQNLRSGP